MTLDALRLTIQRIAVLLFGGSLLVAAVLTVGFLVHLLQVRPSRTAAAAATAQDPSEALLAVDDRDARMTVRAERKRQENGFDVYDGRVEIRTDRLQIKCQHAERSLAGQEGRVLLKGNGGVVVRGVPGFDKGITADSFRLHGDRGELRLAGEVRLSGASGVQKYRLCNVDPSGKVTGGVTLLDDFMQSEGIDRKLGLIDFVTAVYRDDELPPEACYLWAMKLLNRHMTWHAPYDPPLRYVAAPVKRSGEDGAKGTKKSSHNTSPLPKGEGTYGGTVPGVASDPWRWSEAHPGEPWMHASPKHQEFWRFRERRHGDITRAVRLLKRPAADSEDLARRQHWLAEIARNNTVVTMDVLANYRPGKAGMVVVDVRNADKLSLRLYRVTRPEPWAAVAQRLGCDYITWNKPAGNASPSSADDGKSVLQKLDIAVVVRQWRETVAELESLDLSAAANRPTELPDHLDPQSRIRWQRRYAPAPGQPSSWRCGRLVEIPAEALKTPGRYILAVDANGQTAYAPIAVEP